MNTIEETHPDTLEALQGLGTVLILQNKNVHARLVFERLVALRKKVLGDEHIDTLLSMTNLAIVLGRLDRGEDAISLFRHVWEKQKVLKPNHPDTMTTANNLADLLQRMNRNEEAETILGEVLAVQVNKFGNDFYLTSYTKCTLGEVLVRQRRFGDALPLFRDAYEIATKNDDAVPPNYRAIFQGLYGDCLARLNRYDEAEPLLLESYTHLRDTNDAYLQTITQSVLDLYRNWGKKDELDSFRRKMSEAQDRSN